jgi:2-dehydropantoate 2-reductase
MAQVSTTIASPGVIRQTGEFNAFVFAERDSRPSDRVSALRKAINDAGSSAPETDDIERDVWSKFVLFSAVSGVTAAGRCTIRDILGIAELGELFRRVMAETAAVGRAMGIALPPDIEDRTWATANRLPPAMRASTAIDLEKGLPLEIDWISGAVVRLAESAGLGAPANETLYAILLPHKNGKQPVA